MKNTKYMVIDAQLYDYAYVEEKLTRLAAEGWHLESAGNMLWKFRRGEPKAVRYAVTFAPSASVYNSRPTEEEEDLADLCAQAGWVRVAAQAQRHIYRNSDPNATPLETDEAERLKNIRRTMKKHFFPTEILMVAIFVMQFFMHYSTMTRSPARTLSSPMMISTLGISLFVAAIHAFLALNGHLWLRRARRAVDSGEEIPVNRFYRRFRWVVWIFLILYLLCLFWSVGAIFLTWVVVTSTVILLVTWGGIALGKKLNAPKWVNMVVPAGLCALAVMILMPILVLSMDLGGGDLHKAEILPVTLTQLTGETGTERFVMEESSSFLCSYGRYWDTGADDVRITYTIVDVKCPLFYDMLLNEQEQQFLMGAGGYVADPEVAAHAELLEAEYARHAMNGLGDRWFICWNDRIVHLRAGWELTNEQLQIIKDSLMP